MLQKQRRLRAITSRGAIEKSKQFDITKTRLSILFSLSTIIN